MNENIESYNTENVDPEWVYVLVCPFPQKSLVERKMRVKRTKVSVRF